MSDADATERIRAAMPLCATLGMTADRFDAEAVVLSLEWKQEWCTSAALMHGGMVMTLADSAGGACAFANLPEGAIGTSTIESKTNFLGGVREGVVTATARPLHVGSTTIVVETEVMAGGRMVAKTTQTQIVLRPRSTMIRLHVVVEGRVQGVWYRESCRRQADANRVSGWVRNNPDGSVEAALEGDAVPVARVLEWMRQGPPQAIVTNVRITEEPPRNESGFAVR